MTNHQQHHFRFLDLPAELRNAVYGFVFEDTTIEIDHYFDGDTKERHWVALYYNGDHRRTRSPALLSVNTQLLAEALPVLYSKARFIFDSERDLSIWIRGITIGCRNAITHIQFSSLCVQTLDQARLQGIEDQAEKAKAVVELVIRGSKSHLALCGMALCKFDFEVDVDKSVIVCRKRSKGATIVIVE